jgi:hypothetical protein
VDNFLSGYLHKTKDFLPVTETLKESVKRAELAENGGYDWTRLGWNRSADIIFLSFLEYFIWTDKSYLLYKKSLLNYLILLKTGKTLLSSF